MSAPKLTAAQRRALDNVANWGLIGDWARAFIASSLMRSLQSRGLVYAAYGYWHLTDAGRAALAESEAKS